MKTHGLHILIIISFFGGNKFHLYFAKAAHKQTTFSKKEKHERIPSAPASLQKDTTAETQIPASEESIINTIASVSEKQKTHSVKRKEKVIETVLNIKQSQIPALYEEHKQIKKTFSKWRDTLNIFKFLLILTAITAAIGFIFLLAEIPVLYWFFFILAGIILAAGLLSFFTDLIPFFPLKLVC